MISFDAAFALLAGAARPLGSETVPLAEAAGRILVEPVHAMVDAPFADLSSMDGYAVREADLAALPAALPVAGESAAGGGPVASLPPGAAMRIFTGAPVPAGADRVVMQEQVRREGDRALFDERPGAARFIRVAGSDFRTGDLLLAAGTRLDPRNLVAAAAGDVGEVTVGRRPRVGLIATGDELAEPGRARAARGQIPDSISVALAALVAEAGGLVAGQRRLRDDPAALREGAAAALAEANLVVVTGGASVGERDYAKTMFAEIGLDLIFSKVAIKPGKPVWLGRVGHRLVLGLPGNPTSALVTARLFLLPLLRGLSGGEPRDALRWRMAPLGRALEATGPRETFARAVLEDGAVKLLGQQDSGAQLALAQAELLIRLAPGTAPVPAGTMVPVLDF
ncbi:molybdopterin molybdotransferase MoeA [Sphingomonas rosea]|uniref:Molybdopterin molybdenumtransferase n=1 Tax=Sphingomonas rosea TaxID=335605 RepID=A0ABP7U068_9SPHN